MIAPHLQRARDSFYVSMHDVTPIFSDQILRLIEELGPLIDGCWSAAVVPQWHGEPVSSFDHSFVDVLQSAFGERLLHGYFHRREHGRGWIPFLTNGEDELNGLSLEETERRLSDGQSVMEQLFGDRVNGYVAPTFQKGKLNSRMLAEHGVEFLVGVVHTEFQDGRRTPLSTWCWDVGDNLTLCRLGDRVSTSSRWLRPRAMPHVTIHPVDLDRGFLPRIRQVIRELLDEGRRPILMRDLNRLAAQPANASGGSKGVDAAS